MSQLGLEPGKHRGQTGRDEMDHGLDCSFTPLVPTEGSLCYKNPVLYSEMLEVVASIELEKLVASIK